MKQLIAALGQDIKPRGSGWIAKCKVHNDKDFAMSIRQEANGMVIAHCHACGANGHDLYKALGLDLDELFGGRRLERPEYTTEHPHKLYLPQHLRDQHELDQACVLIHEHDKEQRRYTPLADKKRYRLAAARMEGTEQKFMI